MLIKEYLSLIGSSQLFDNDFKIPIIQQNKYMPVRAEPKIKRNELCPCGSNKKYKLCCMYKKVVNNEQS